MEQATAALAAQASELDTAIGGGTTVEDTFEADNNSGTISGGANDMYETGDVKLPPPAAYKHRGTLVSLTRRDAKTGSVGILTTALSTSNGLTYERTTWLPTAFAANVKITQEELAELPVPDGKKESPLIRFAKTVHNSKNTAELDEIVSASIAIGRTPFGKSSYTDLDSFIAALNTLASGVPIQFTTKVEASDTFQDKVILNKIFSADHDMSKIKQPFADEV